MQDFWTNLVESIKNQHNAENNNREMLRQRKVTKVWRKDTFKAFYLLKYNAKRKTVQRKIRPSLSVGIWCRHLPTDNFMPGYHPKMDGFSIRDSFGGIVNINPELPQTITVEPFMSHPLTVSQENRPKRKEYRRQVTRPIWRDGQKDTIEDATTVTEWREHIVRIATLSNRCSFDYTYTDESEMLGPKDSQISRKQFREDSCKRWIEPRLDFEGNLLPQNSLAICDDGRQIPDLTLDDWKLGSDGYILDSIPRYVVKSVLSAFRLNLQGGNASNNGGLRPCYSGKQRSDIRHEFVQECLQEIAVAHLMCLRNITRFTGVLNSALSRILTEFVRRYCSGGSNRDRSALVERTKRNANALATRLSQFADLQYQDENAREIVRMASSGETQTEIADRLKISQPKVSRILKETIALNRVLAQLQNDANE